MFVQTGCTAPLRLFSPTDAVCARYHFHFHLCTPLERITIKTSLAPNCKQGDNKNINKRGSSLRK